MTSDIYEIVARVFSIPVSQVNEESSPENIELDRFHGMDPNVGKFIGFLENSLSKYNMEGM